MFDQIAIALRLVIAQQRSSGESYEMAAVWLVQELRRRGIALTKDPRT